MDQESLEKEKSSLSKVNSLHIYSIQPRRMATTESLYENDLSQSKIHGSAVKLVSLGRVCLDECWSMHQEGKPSPPKMQKACKNLDCPTRASTIHVGEEKEKAILKLKDASSEHADPQPVKKVEEKGGNHKESSQFTKTGNDSKRKMQVIDSDDEGVANISVHGDKKFRTYINDNGEEVTGSCSLIFISKIYRWHGFLTGFFFLIRDKKILTKQYAAEIMEKTNEASNRTMNAKIREPCPPVQKKSSKPKEQKTIASFFSKRN